MANIKLGGTTAMTETGGVVTMASPVLNTGGLRSQQVFTNSSGTHVWTRPSGITTIKVTITGGGAGGGGGNVSNYNHGGGGAAGGTVIKILDVTDITTSTVTIGAGGGGGSQDANGTAGGTSSFVKLAGTGTFTTLTANGGEAGQVASGSTGDETTGGTATGGDINIQGGDGGSRGGGTTSDETAGPAGGASFWGGGGWSRHMQVGTHAKPFGAGGGGGDGNGSTGYAGGDGKHGICVVEEYS